MIKKIPRKRNKDKHFTTTTIVYNVQLQLLHIFDKAFGDSTSVAKMRLMMMIMNENELVGMGKTSELSTQREESLTPDSS